MKRLIVLAGVALVPQAVWAQPHEPYQVGTENTKLVDASRQREIGIKFYYPKDVTAPAAVILISHGGLGSDRGEHALAQLGPVYAAHGFLAINLGHRTSVNQQAHRRDRPADVSFVLDALASSALPLPREFKGRADLERVGHAGHSWGAYTAHALGGATFDQGQFRDPRIDAIVPISPQGPDQFGSYDRGPSDNSWSSVRIPAFNLAGGAELNGPPGEFRMDRWRAKPFERYPAIGDKFLAIVPDQNHGQMGGGGSPAVKAYQAENSAAFFDVYLRGRTERVCDIGAIALVAGVAFERTLDPKGQGPRRCPPSKSQ